MRSIIRLASTLGVTLLVLGDAGAQPPGTPPPPFRPGQVLPPGIRDELNLTKAQAEEIARLEADVKERLAKVLTAEQQKKLDDLAPPPPPGARVGRGGRGGFPGGRGLSAEQIVDRILSFDKNGDGKVTKDELPERMQDLIAKGDANKDGALDRDEVKKLAADLARDRGVRGFGAGRFLPPGGFAPPGGFGPGGVERALADLKLSDKTKQEKAEAVVKAHQEKVRKLMDDTREELLKQMKDVLSEEEFKTFKEAVERRPGFGNRPR
jgi:Spy/CpxP family protein refolding chaperone